MTSTQSENYCTACKGPDGNHSTVDTVLFLLHRNVYQFPTEIARPLQCEFSRAVCMSPLPRFQENTVFELSMTDDAIQSWTSLVEYKACMPSLLAIIASMQYGMLGISLSCSSAHACDYNCLVPVYGAVPDVNKHLKYVQSILSAPDCNCLCILQDAGWYAWNYIKQLVLSETCLCILTVHTWPSNWLHM